MKRMRRGTKIGLVVGSVGIVVVGLMIAGVRRTMGGVLRPLAPHAFRHRRLLYEAGGATFTDEVVDAMHIKDMTCVQAEQALLPTLTKAGYMKESTPAEDHITYEIFDPKGKNFREVEIYSAAHYQGEGILVVDYHSPTRLEKFIDQVENLGKKKTSNDLGNSPLEFLGEK